MVAKDVKASLSKSSWIRKMFEEGAKLKARYGADNVYDFSLGNPDLQPPKEVIDAIREHAAVPNTHKYMPNAGFIDVREKIAGHVSADAGMTVPATNIVMTVGAAGGLNTALKALLNPGDEVIVLAPYFVEYLFYIKNHGGVPVIVQTQPDSFHLDIDEIYEAITERTKAIIINSPNNPTGVVYNRAELEQLADILKDRRQALQTDICILSDEPYVQLTYGVDVPNLFTIYDDVMIINSYSKSLALPGGRIGYIAVSPQFSELDDVMAALSFTLRTLGFVNAPAIYQKAIGEALNVSVDVNIYRERRDVLYDMLTSLGFECIKPEGAFYLFVKSPIEDDVAFAKMATKYNILIVPGSGFGCSGYFRLTYCVGMDTIKGSKGAFEELSKEVF